MDSRTAAAAEERLASYSVALPSAISPAADSVVIATAARRVVMEPFRAGVITSSDVLDADLAVLQAELDLTRSRAQAHLAQARLDRAVGK